mmetsp:Transcript_14537/g.34456  ORF Transcript_14537/g.34456 Transcript_14537/m.34456 type:complete len:240 (+) Transcript_14537:1-720(+)
MQHVEHATNSLLKGGALPLVCILLISGLQISSATSYMHQASAQAPMLRPTPVSVDLTSDTSQAETALSPNDESSSLPKELSTPSTELRRSFDAVKNVIPITVDDPSAFADWSCEAMQSVVTAAGGDGMPPPPAWVGGSGPLTTDSLRRSIIARVGSAAGGTQGSFCWGPNNQSQFSNVMILLTHIEADAWMQAVAAAAGVGVGTALGPLAVTYSATDRSCVPQPINRAPPPAYARHLFA